MHETIEQFDEDLAAVGLPKSRQVSIDECCGSYVFFDAPSPSLRASAPRIGRLRQLQNTSGLRRRVWVYESGRTVRLLILAEEEDGILAMVACRSLARRQADRSNSPRLRKAA